MPVHDPIAQRNRRRLLKFFIAGPLIAGGAVLVSTGGAQAADCSVDSYLVQTDSSEVTDDAACIQEALTELGYDSGPVDGWFGPITEGAVSRYQTDNGLTIDGQVGAETAGALGVWVSDSDGSDGSDDVESSSDSVSSDEPDVAPEPDYDDGGAYWPWDALAQCESGGNWHIDTGNGYYGGLQFAWGSWEAAGGSGNPAHASVSEQIHRGEILQDMQGWGAWPTCARQIGLL